MYQKMAVSDDVCAPWDHSNMGVYLTFPSFRCSNVAKDLTKGQEITCILLAEKRLLFILPRFDILGIELAT